MKSFWKILLSFGFLVTGPAFAQNEGGKSGGLINESAVGWELGAFVGNVLPNQVSGATEIFPQWGARGGWNIGNGTFAEVGGTGGRGEGVDWSSMFTSLRMSSRLENILAITYLGLDLVYYSADQVSKQLYFGGHVGGGFMTPISDSVWFRADMKFNVSPGTSLTIMGGFMFRIPGSGGGGSS